MYYPHLQLFYEQGKVKWSRIKLLSFVVAEQRVGSYEVRLALPSESGYYDYGPGYTISQQ